MLLAPADKPFDYRHLPRLSLGLSLLLLVMAYFFLPADAARQSHLDDVYQDTLLRTEWTLYSPYLGQSQRADQIPAIEQAFKAGDGVRLARQLGFDRRFEANVLAGGTNYLEPDILSQWQSARAAYDAERNRLSNQVIGLDPQRFRPVTFLTYTFTDTNAYAVLLSVLVLVLIGIAVEWSAGSGVMLSAWLAGSIAGGLCYLIFEGRGVFPLVGSAPALCGLLGLAMLEFRERGSLRLGESVFTFSGIWLALVLAGVIGGIYLLHGKQPFWLAALPVAAAAGAVVGGLSQRWFNRDEEAEPEPAPVMDDSLNEEFRKDLNQVMLKIAEMQFVSAEKHIRVLLEKYPGDRRLFEQLYHLAKLSPGNLEFEELAFALMTQPGQTESNQVALRVFRDYIRRSQTHVALDADTCLQLVMRFTRIDALKEAEDLFKRAQDAKTVSALLPKAAMALARAYAAKQMEQRSAYYEKLAKTAI